jgi:predicted O-linked N-acetylglucosamine transferase (SPINDLY family)
MAVVRLCRATDAEPEDREILAMLAKALVLDGRMVSALHTYNKLIALGEVSAGTWCAMGHALVEVGEYAQAIRVYEKSIGGRRDYAEAHHHLGQACFEMGDIDRAMQHMEIAANHSERLVTWLALATLVPGAPSADLKKILAIRRFFAERLGKDLPSKCRPTPQRVHSRQEKIRLGYVSAFFHRSNYMKPVWALLNNHDRSRFEIHLFSDSHEKDRMEGYVHPPEDKIHYVTDLSNDALAEMIAECGIDILIDLNAYSTPERLGLFLTPPAPVCVAWFNMYATSGLPGFHYIIGDDEVVSEDEEPFYSEKVIRLPVSYLTFSVRHRAPPVVDPPCLTTMTITFGSLVAQYKINSEVRLLIANRAMNSPQNQVWLKDRFADLGINPGRVTLLGPADHYEYLQYYDQIDIALDAFPYNGGVTTMEAIWQGVPVLTFNGDRWASRTSQTLLRRTHLREFVARNAEDMIAVAVRLAKDDDSPERLRLLRRGMRSTLQRSSACDVQSLVRSMERFFESVKIHYRI